MGIPRLIADRRGKAKASNSTREQRKRYQSNAMRRELLLESEMRKFNKILQEWPCVEPVR